MKNLFLIDGASGSGKSDLLEYVTKFHLNVRFVRKLSTRAIRDYENHEDWIPDLEFVTEEEFDLRKPDYQYVYFGKRYGVSRSDLDRSLAESENVFVIIRDAETIKCLCKDYSFINVVPVFIYTDADELRKRLKRQNFSPEQRNLRLTKIRAAFSDYLKHPAIYREVLINNSSTADYERLVEIMLSKYQLAPVVDDKLVFVLMAFNSPNPNMVDYYRAMQRAVNRVDSNLQCINLDEVSGSFPISKVAKNQIRNCRLAIIDLTENRPNVYYELGYAHGIEKDILITALEETEPLFYPRQYKIIFYKNAEDLETKLFFQIQAILDKSGNCERSEGTA